MSEGIKALPDNDQDNQDANLGLSGGISGGGDKGDLGGNLFLSAPEQRGLEAATFGTVLGQAPATGNIFGDLLSLAAQTAPASLATFKERQNIKEKEAEYKSKKTSLAGKIKDYYDTSGLTLLHRTLTDQEAYAINQAEPGRLIPYFSKTANPIEVLDNDPNSITYGRNIPVGSPVYYYENLLTERENAKRKANNQEELPLPYLPAKKMHVIYDMNLPNHLDQKQSIDSEQLKKLRKEKGPSYMANVSIDEEPERYKAESNRLGKISDSQVEAQQKVTSRLISANTMLNYANSIQKDISKNGLTGPGGSLALGAAQVRGLVDSGFKFISTAFFGDNDKAEQRARVEYNSMGGDKAIKDHLQKKVDGKEKLTKSEQLVYDVLTGNLKGTDEMIATAQNIKTSVTQLVYMIAKTRESGGKFSVPDIQFAFDSIGNTADPVTLLTGIQNMLKQTIGEVVITAQSAYFSPYDNKVVEVIDLYKNPKLTGVRPILEFHLNENLGGLSSRPESEQTQWRGLLTPERVLQEENKNKSGAGGKDSVLPTGGY